MSGVSVRTISLMILGCAHALAASTTSPATSNFDGMILRVSGACSVTSNKVVSPAHPGDLLRTGDQLTCQQGNMFFHIGCTDQLIHYESAPVAVAWAKGKVPCNEKLIRSAYESYGTVAAGKKGGGNFFISPAHEHAVSPGVFALRWNPQSGKSLQFEIRESKAENALWKSDAVDGGSGMLESPQLREALAAAQSPDSAKSLELRALGAAGKQVTHFQLISAADEKDLKKELAAIEFIGGNPFFREVARAATLKRHGLAAEAAQSFDAALAMSPQSPLLRERAIEMNELIGNKPRVRELTAATH